MITVQAIRFVYSLKFKFLRPFGSKRLLASPSAYV